VRIGPDREGKEREGGAEALKMAQTAVYEYCNGPVKIRTKS